MATPIPIDQMMWKMVAPVLRILLICGVVMIVIAVFRLLFQLFKGRLGEASINFRTQRLLDQSVYHLIPDVMLPTPDGTTQIDHVIVSRYGIFVVETKTYKGWIYGGERDAQWTQVNYRRKDRFQNPLRQNYKHTKTLSELTGIPESYFNSLVVFVGEAKFKTTMPANVVYAQDFHKYIKSHQTPIIKDEQVSEIVGVIQEWAGTVSDDQKADHVKNLRQNKAPVAASGPAPVCPRCGEPMVLRTSRKDGNHFWGCSKYPKCKGTKQVA